MSFAIKPDQRVAQEVCRLAARQLELAAEELQAQPAADEPHQHVHEARRHLKKVRALMRLARPALTSHAWNTNRRLRAAGRALAPLADADAMVQLIGVLAARFAGERSREVDAALRPLLVDRRDRISRAMTVAGGHANVIAQIDATRDRLERWRLTGSGFRVVGGGLRRSARRARRACQRALERPTGERYHAWRQRVKDLWLQVRLLEQRTGGRLGALEAQLEQLDGVLGQYHDCTLLRELLAGRVARTRRLEATGCLWLIRRYQIELRRQARTLAVDVHRATPRELVDHVRGLWRAASLARAATAQPRTPWRDAA